MLASTGSSDARSRTELIRPTCGTFSVHVRGSQRARTSRCRSSSLSDLPSTRTATTVRAIERGPGPTLAWSATAGRSQTRRTRNDRGRVCHRRVSSILWPGAPPPPPLAGFRRWCGRAPAPAQFSLPADLLRGVPVLGLHGTTPRTRRAMAPEVRLRSHRRAVRSDPAGLGRPPTPLLRLSFSRLRA